MCGTVRQPNKKQIHFIANHGTCHERKEQYTVGAYYREEEKIIVHKVRKKSVLCVPVQESYTVLTVANSVKI